LKPNQAKNMNVLNRTRSLRVVKNGFTIMELLVVITIMMLMLGALTINLGGQRAKRNLNIAQNELVTNLRKAQSFTLSSRAVIGTKPGQVYIIKIDAANPTQYTLEALYDVRSSPKFVTIETIKLPAGVTFLLPNPATITRNVSPANQAYSCGLVAFKTPFAKTYLNGGCNATNPRFQPGDDYLNVLNHVVNDASTPSSVDSAMLVQLGEIGGTNTRKILIKGISGLICPTTDGVICSN